MTGRHGYALIAVLWLMVGAGTIAAGTTLAARQWVRAAANRVALLGAGWEAAGCAARVLEQIDVQLSSGRAWRDLDVALAEGAAAASDLGGCEVSLDAVGARLDINAADGLLLRRLLAAVGLPAATGDSLADAVLDWRDPDDEPRPFGAERAWYAGLDEFAPRNQAIADVRELARVRGVSAVPALSRLVGTEPGRISLTHAPLALLAALPGFTAEAVARVAERRARGERALDVAQLSRELSSASRDSLAAWRGVLSELTAADPEAWILEVRASGSAPAPAVTLEHRLAFARGRAVAVRSREW